MPNCHAFVHGVRREAVNSVLFMQRIWRQLHDAQASSEAEHAREFMALYIQIA